MCVGSDGSNSMTARYGPEPMGVVAGGTSEPDGGGAVGGAASANAPTDRASVAALADRILRFTIEPHRVATVYLYELSVNAAMLSDRTVAFK